MNLATLEIVECLVDTSNGAEDSTIEFIELLGFPKDTSECHGYLNSTDFRMRLKHTENAVRRGQMTKMAHPRTEIEYVTTYIFILNSYRVILMKFKSIMFVLIDIQNTFRGMQK